MRTCQQGICDFFDDQGFHKFQLQARVDGGLAAGVTPMSTPDLDESHLPDMVSSHDTTKKNSWASVVKNRPSLSKHEYTVSVKDGSSVG